MERIVFSDEAKADIRNIPQQVAMNILTAIHRLAESGAGRVKMLQGQEGDKRLRVGDFRVRYTEESGELHIHAVKNRKDDYRCGASSHDRSSQVDLRQSPQPGNSAGTLCGVVIIANAEQGIP